MCVNPNQMLHSNVAQHEINVSVLCGAPLYPIRFHQFVNHLKQDQIISELKAKEVEMLRQMQQSPKQFDSSKLKINIECPEPRNIASGMSFKIQNPQPIAPQRTNTEPAGNTQEKFYKHSIQNIEVLSSLKLIFDFHQFFGINSLKTVIWNHLKEC